MNSIKGVPLFKRPHPRDRMGGGYFYGCRPVALESIPPQFLEPNPEIHPNFLEILETLDTLETLGTVVVRSARRQMTILG